MSKRWYFGFCLVSLILFGASCTPSKSQGPSAVRVGSKAFTESVILGELLKHLSEEAGASTQHLAELGGTQILWNALQSGDLDAYVDYTGTISEEILNKAIQGKGLDPKPDQTDLQSDSQAIAEERMRQALKGLGIHMSKPIGFNNTYALGMRRDVANRVGIQKISDLRGKSKLKFGLSDEFLERGDGWRALAAAYQLETENIRTMDHNLAYRGLVHDAIQVTDLYSTDAEIKFYDLLVLEDDLNFFPQYNAVLLMREDLFQRAPQVSRALLKLEGMVSPEEMSGMTASVRFEKDHEGSVSATYLNQKLQMQIPVPEKSAWMDFRRVLDRLSKTTFEHLYLVLFSLTLAILIAIPLGILSARSQAVGNIVLATVSVIQTLPSMALLVFMIPLFGLGPVPAIAALFFYSLDRKSTRLNSSHEWISRMPSSA